MIALEVRSRLLGGGCTGVDGMGLGLIWCRKNRSEDTMLGKKRHT